MKIEKAVQIKLSDSLKETREVIEKLGALGFFYDGIDIEEWWDAIFIKGRMSLVAFEYGEIVIANYIDPLFEQYDSIDEFIIDTMIEKQTRTISVRMSKEAVDYVEELAEKENKGMWSIVDKIILNHKRNGFR